MKINFKYFCLVNLKEDAMLIIDSAQKFREFVYRVTHKGEERVDMEANITWNKLITDGDALPPFNG